MVWWKGVRDAFLPISRIVGSLETLCYSTIDEAPKDCGYSCIGALLFRCRGARNASPKQNKPVYNFLNGYNGQQHYQECICNFYFPYNFFNIMVL